MRRLLHSFGVLVLLSCAEGTVARKDYAHYSATCEKGINQQVDLADPLKECADAQNVWAPNGRVEQRPGYLGLTTVSGETVATSLTFFGRTEDTSAGTFTSPIIGNVLTLSNLVGRVASGGDMDRWYIGRATAFDVIAIESTAPNANSTRYKAEYWNGSAWIYLPLVELDVNSSSRALRHIATAAAAFLEFLVNRPQDWAATTVDGQNAFWIRFNLLNANIDAATTVDLDGNTRNIVNVRGMFVARFPTLKRYIFYTVRSDAARVINNASTLMFDDNVRYATTGAFSDTAEPISYAVISEFDEVYVMYDYLPTVYIADPATTTATTATVEARNFAVGAGAPFDRTLIAQDGTFPQAKYIEFFKGHLWAANLLGRPHSVKWSAPSPYYRVWPSLNEEPLVENDNSPITGLHGFNEHMVVFKNDSIWLMTDTGLNDFELQTYAPVKVVSGVGGVSNSSIKEVRGQLIFLAEDGIYAFNGTPAIKKLSDRINDTISHITPGRRPFATAAHWRSKSCYLLAVSVDGSDANNRVLVWDYKNDAWWIWTNIEAQHWLEDEGSYDEELIYFGDASGRIYQIGVGDTDHGGTISSYVHTHRLGYNTREKKTIREVRVSGDSQFTDPVISIFANDAVTATQTGTLDMNDPVETTASRPLVRRIRRMDFRVENDWAQIRIANSTKYEKLVLSSIDVGFTMGGRR